jgi:nicotinamidase/pyrazinamidase
MNINSTKSTEAQQKAILVVDIQEDYTGLTAKPPFPYKDSERLIGLVNKVIKKAAEQKFAIVYITQEFDGMLGKTFSTLFCHGTAIKGQPGTRLDSRLHLVSPNHFSKPKANAFSNQELGAFLEKHHIHDLYLVGLDAAFCVDQTAKGGVHLGYNVHVIHDCIVTRFEKRWKRLHQKYAQKGITLISSHEFLEPMEG